MLVLRSGLVVIFIAAEGGAEQIQMNGLGSLHLTRVKLYPLDDRAGLLVNTKESHVHAPMNR
jgi:hypothetical protein